MVMEFGEKVLVMEIGVVPTEDALPPPQLAKPIESDAIKIHKSFFVIRCSLDDLPRSEVVETRQRPNGFGSVVLIGGVGAGRASAYAENPNSPIEEPFDLPLLAPTPVCPGLFESSSCGENGEKS
jgi:hypothetical protein